MDKHQKIESILASLDGLQRAEPRPFFFTRLQGRLSDREGFWERLGRLIARPAIAVSVLLIILALNISLVLRDEVVQTETVLQEDQDDEALEYSIATIYNYESEPDEK